jgi:pimeloyl-ACP methyl ester carboxylesterase
VAVGPAAGAVRVADLWDDLSGLAMPLTLVRGGNSPVVDDGDVAELRRRRPAAEVVVVEGAGHSVQGDRPAELARLIAERLDRA